MAFINSTNGKILLGFILSIVAILTLNIKTIYSITVWLHVLAGITWIGLLYYFNFVQTPAMAAILSNKQNPAVIGQHIAPRALLWFRMAAALTWLIGLSLLAQSSGMKGIILAFTFSNGFEVIGLGSWLGTIMAFNVWFIIWPNQQKILGIKDATDKEILNAKKYAALASSINVILSIPMLLSMIAWR